MKKEILVLHYPNCGTCKKALKWLAENKIEVTLRDIAKANPTAEELTEWIAKSNLPTSKFFNTSGLIYKERNLKDVVKTASQDELIKLLAENGMLVKRPLVIAEGFVLVGFKQEEWTEKLL